MTKMEVSFGHHASSCGAPVDSLCIWFHHRSRSHTRSWLLTLICFPQVLWVGLCVMSPWSEIATPAPLNTWVRVNGWLQAFSSLSNPLRCTCHNYYHQIHNWHGIWRDKKIFGNVFNWSALLYWSYELKYLFLKIIDKSTEKPRDKIIFLRFHCCGTWTTHKMDF